MINAPETINDPILGTFYYSENVKYLGDQGEDLYSLSYVFDLNGEGIQYWTAIDGSGTESMKITWTNLGNNEYMVKIINPNGAVYGENLILDGDFLYSKTDAKNDGLFLREVKMAEAGQTADPIIGTFKYSKAVHYMKETEGVMYVLYYVFDLDENGLQYWFAEDGSHTEALKFSWTNLGDGNYMVKMVNPDRSIYGENLHLEGDILRSETELESGGEFVRVTTIMHVEYI
ncbi:MAG TPA: hypothetical protein O0X39_04135 [Methanocorpusculum sp.]|nr:hypothetical protein [Methanocorpusculum sp.]